MHSDQIKIKALPKGELHVHLNGLISPDIVKRILSEENVEIPESFNLDKDLTHSFPCTSLQEYLKPWEVLRLIPRNRGNLHKIIENAFCNLKNENVTFVEIRNTIIYISLINNISVETALSWVILAIEESSEKFGIAAGLILTISRGDYSLDHFQALIQAYKRLGKPKVIVGLDLAGNEETPIPEDLGKQFVKAKHDLGLGITIHAGETGKVSNIISAINDFQADRIGHGTAAGNCSETMFLLRDRDICVEVCPISNRLTNAVIKEDRHPVLKFIEHGVPFVICSDNPGIHQLSISDDYLEFYKETKNITCLEKMYDLQKKYTFINSAL